MKNAVTLLKTKTILLLMFFMLGLMAPITMLVAQPKISDFGEIESKTKSATTSIITIAKYVLGAVFAIGLIFVIYNVVTKNPHAREWVIGYVIGLVVYIIFAAFL